MLRDGLATYEADGWAAVAASERSPRWKAVDAQLHAIAKQYVSLEAQLAHWLREAHRVKVWKYAGCVSMNEYLERVFGFSPLLRPMRRRVEAGRSFRSA